MFVPALLALLPGHVRWLNVIPIEGLLGRVVGRFAHPLLEPHRCLHRVRQRAGGCSLSLDGLLVFVDSTVGADSLCFRDGAMESLSGLAGGSGEAAAAERIGEAADFEAGGEDTVDSLAPVRRGGTDGARAGRTGEPRRTGIERTLGPEIAEENVGTGAAMGGILPESLAAVEDAVDPEVTQRADSDHKAKTTMPRIAGGYKLPSSSLLQRPDEQQAVDADELKLLAQVLTEKYAEFEVHGQITQINPGPVVTTFEFKPDAGIKYSRITNLTDDLCLALKAESILIERMAGKSTVGIQVPNREREIIWLRENIESQEFMGSKSKLTMALGKDINGRIVVADLAGMPHLLIAGSTGRRQERGHQCLHHVDSVQGDAGSGAADSGGSEAAGVGQLRRRAASLYADHYRTEAGGQCAAQRRARDGTAAEAAGSEGRAQHRSVQPAVRQRQHRACLKKIPTTSRFLTS